MNADKSICNEHNPRNEICFLQKKWATYIRIKIINRALKSSCGPLIITTNFLRKLVTPDAMQNCREKPASHINIEC